MESPDRNNVTRGTKFLQLILIYPILSVEQLNRVSFHLGFLHLIESSLVASLRSAYLQFPPRMERSLNPIRKIFVSVSQHRMG